MPMVPSPLAALTYTAVKVVGYSLFANQLNKYLGTKVSPYKFGFVKTIIGLAGGLIYVLLIVPHFDNEQNSELFVFLWASPVRIIAWAIALGIFYGFRKHTLAMVFAVFLGVFWSYILDGAMWLIYKALPGMVMPFC